MRVTTKLTIDMTTGATLEHEWYDYVGAIALCKGDKTIQGTEQSQANFSNTLQKAFAAQYANQKQVLDFLQGTLKPQIENPTGLDPATKAALNSQVINQSAEDFQNSLKGANAITAGRGGATALPSGVEAQITGQLAGQQASAESSGLTSVQEEDQQLKQQNYWNAVNGLNGVAAQVNPLGYAGQASGAAGEVAGLGQAYKTSQQSQLLGALGGLAGGAGTALGGYFGGKHQ
jgi:hypothetical protein